MQDPNNFEAYDPGGISAQITPVRVPPQASAPALTPGEPIPTVADLIDLHSEYGENIEFDDADHNTYSQETCQCGMPLGAHLSLEAHRANEVEAFIVARLAESFLTVRNQLQLVATELALHNAPMHIQADLDQIIVENSLRVGLKDPEVETKARALRAAVTELGLPHGVDFHNQDGAATFIWQQHPIRVTVYVTHGEPFEVEIVPGGPVTPFRSDDPAAVAVRVAELLGGSAGQEKVPAKRPEPYQVGAVIDFGVHDPHAEGQTCVLEKPIEETDEEHYCWRRVHHDGDHRCSCGYEWQRSQTDAW
jgi:hypothetical protein